MRTVLLLAVLGSCWALAAQATVYRWVDADGVLHFSDQPHQGATEIQVAEPQTYSAPKVAPVNGAAAAAASAKTRNVNFRYTNCSVGSPAAESSVVDVETLGVSVGVEPGLRPTDRISLYYDGGAVPGSGGTSTSFQINGPERGTHTLSVSISDANGAIVCQSGPLNFYVHQPSTLAPQNPNSPANRTLPTIH
jgi:hypothetical protein